MRFPSLIALVGFSTNDWNLTDQGPEKWRWVWSNKTYQATDGAKAVLAIMGHSKKAAFIIFLSTTVSDLNANNQLYQQWYESIRVN